MTNQRYHPLQKQISARSAEAARKEKLKDSISPIPFEGCAGGVAITNSDYDRASKCVEACSNITDPVDTLQEVKDFLYVFTTLAHVSNSAKERAKHARTLLKMMGE